MDLAAFAALIKRKRGERRLTQESLAIDVFGDPARKADISRIENARVQPQEATIQRLARALGITHAELDPVRTARPGARQLGEIPTLSRDELELLASRFDIPRPHALTDAQLRDVLTKKAEEYRAYRGQIEAIDERTAGLGDLKAAAQNAADTLDFEEVETLLAHAHEVETEIAAETAELRARNALLRGRAEQAHRLLSAAADSFAAIDSDAPLKRKWDHMLSFFDSGRSFGTAHLNLSRRLAQDIGNHLDDGTKTLATVQMTEAAICESLARFAPDPKGRELLHSAIDLCRQALKVLNKTDHPSEYAGAHTNMALAMQRLGMQSCCQIRESYFRQAINSHREALECIDAETDRLKSGTVRANLAIALSILAVDLFDGIDFSLFEESLDWFDQGMPIIERDGEGEKIAQAQSDYGIALKEYGMRLNGRPGRVLLERSVEAQMSATSFFKPRDHPFQNAICRENLAFAELALADHDSVSDPAPHLRAALAHVEASLEVFDPAHMAANFAKATALRDRLRARLGEA
ncbi:MAG: helix-turn-helix transcriptional regulator [Rhodobacter sp.]|nr:helix-turn-helix transcriptional regulator [Rhodobacter sp.]